MCECRLNNIVQPASPSVVAPLEGLHRHIGCLPWTDPPPRWAAVELILGKWLAGGEPVCHPARLPIVLAMRFCQTNFPPPCPSG